MRKSLIKCFPIFVLPTLFAFVVSFVIPFFWGLFLSFCKFKTVIDFEFVGLESYIKIFEDPKNYFVNSFFFTVKFAIVAVITINVFAFILASLLTKGLNGSNVYRSIFFMPNLVGGIVLGYTWKLCINGFLKAVIGPGTIITSDSTYGYWGLILLINWQLIGYMMVIYIAGLQNIPTELIEAAKIDGATKLQVLKNVTIPMLMPSITICLFLAISNSFKMFDQNLALTGGAPSRTTSLMALDIWLTTSSNTRIYNGVSQAKAVLFFIVVGVVAFIQLVATRKKEVQS